MSRSAIKLVSLFAAGCLAACNSQSSSPVPSNTSLPPTNARETNGRQQGEMTEARTETGMTGAVGQQASADSPVAEDVPAVVPDPDKLYIITFDDLKIEMPADSVYAPSMLTDRVRQLDGGKVRIRGFLFPGTFVQTGITQFPLIMNLECKFGPGGQAHHIILVELIQGVSTDYTTRPIAVTGRLTVKPWEGPDGNTWALYHIAGEKVE